MANVLIVDDALIMRKNLKKIFLQAGHCVVDEAANGIQAIEMYKKYLPDIVTMDITMPGMDGIEALKNLMNEYSSAKVVMVSGLDQKDKVFEALELGAKFYILKPVTTEIVTNAVNTVLYGSKLTS